MGKSWAMALAFAAVVATSCSGDNSSEPPVEDTAPSTTAPSTAPSSSAAEELGNLMWDLSAAPGGWGFVRPEYPALAVYATETGSCTGTFDTLQLLVGLADGVEPKVDSDSTLDAALVAYAEKTGLAADDLEASAADPITVPVTGAGESLELVARTVTAPDGEGVAYGYSDGELALSVVVLCGADVDDPAAEIEPFVADLAMVRESEGRS